MATKNSPGPFDCYAAADPDEPLFVLLARDKHAPTLIWLWAVLRELDGEDAVKVGEARKCCLDMMVWAKAHDRKVVGLGQAALAGMMELIRSLNAASKCLDDKPCNDETSLDMMRRFLAVTSFEVEERAGG